MNKAAKIYALLVVSFATILVFAGYHYSEDQLENRQRTAKEAPRDGLSQRVEGIPMKSEYSFAGERFPIEEFDVRERLDRELMVNSYWHSSTLLNLKNAHRYFPVIEPILARHGVPDDFKYLAVAESSLRNAVSPAGARGMWQFMKATGQEYGMEINGEVDERYHLEISTEAACKYLKSKYERYGSWLLAAVSYNAGASRISNETEVQRADDVFDLNLGEETARYPFRLMAIKEILSNPETYGFYLQPEDMYAPLTDYSTITVTESVDNWGDFAKKYGTTYRLLKVYNPWLRDSRLTVSKGNSYEIRVPEK